MSPVLIHVFVILVIAGAVLYLVNAIVPLDPKFRTALNVVAAVALLLWLLSEFHIFTFR